MNHKTKIILGGFMGNVVEAYDISICYFLSTELSRHLMGNNNGNPTLVLLLIFLAYLAKPLGAFILGLFSDLYGRKNVLIGSILIMGISTALIGLIPTYHQIGLLAPFTLLFLRIIQSMALGSEFLNSATFLVESGDQKQRGFRGCWSSVGVKTGNFLACLIIILINNWTNSPGIQEWIWRVPFILAFFTTVLGVYIRYSMPESLEYIIFYADRPKPTTREIYKQSLNFVKKYPFMFNYAFFAGFLSIGTGFFFFLYTPLHAFQYSHLSQQFIMYSTTLSLLFVSLLIPVFGWFSDYNDRLKMLTFATSGLVVLSYPFMYAINYGNGISFVLMQLLICIPCACYYSASTVLLTELFPLQIRCTALSVAFSVAATLAASLAAGLPPFLSYYLTGTTHLPSSPAFIMMVMSFIVLINIRVLSQRHRTGKNQYDISAFKEEAPVFTMHYQKP